MQQTTKQKSRNINGGEKQNGKTRQKPIRANVDKVRKKGQGNTAKRQSRYVNRWEKQKGEIRESRNGRQKHRTENVDKVSQRRQGSDVRQRNVGQGKGTYK